VRGKLDVAFLRREERADGLVYKLLRREALVVVMPANHKLAARKTIRPSALVDEILIGVPNSNSPVLRALTDRYGKQLGIDLTPDHEALNPAVAISLVASTGGVGLLPCFKVYLQST
jgi:LysR family hca operon transcriptional activator